MVCLSVSQRRKFSCSCQTRSKNSASSRPLTTSTVTRSRICEAPRLGGHVLRRKVWGPAPRHLARRRRDDDGQPPQRKRNKTRAKNAKNCVQGTKKHRLPVGRRCFFRLPLEGTARAYSPAQGKASSALPVLRRVTAKRKNVHGRVLPCTFRVRWGFPGLALRRVSCAGRGPGSGCAAARGRGPGAGCRRHSPGRGSAAGCAGRRLRLP